MYQGAERRAEPRYCDSHVKLCEDVAVIKTTVLALDKRINGSIGAVEKHIENSRSRNLMIILAFVGLIFGFLKGIGGAENQIKVNTGRLDRLEQPKFK